MCWRIPQGAAETDHLKDSATPPPNRSIATALQVSLNPGCVEWRQISKNVGLESFFHVSKRTGERIKDTRLENRLEIVGGLSACPCPDLPSSSIDSAEASAESSSLYWIISGLCRYSPGQICRCDEILFGDC